MTDELKRCPYCGAKAINITLMGEAGPGRFMCAGNPVHEWVNGEGPEVEPGPDPVLDLDDLADAIADRLKSKRKPLLKRITEIFS